MARIAGIDLPRDKRIEIGLTYILRYWPQNQLPIFWQQQALTQI